MPQGRATKTQNINKYCYICGKPATSREHIPPKCFFPEAKEIDNGSDFRKNLITIPSCDKHNMQKSEDDFYLLFVITSHLETNTIAQKHFRTKIMRAIHRNPSLLGFISKFYPITVNGFPSIGYQINKSRFDHSIELISRGLYFHHYRMRWHKAFLILSPQLTNIGVENLATYNNRIREIDKMIEQDQINVPINGGNPDIFSYKIGLNQDHTHMMLRMGFYRYFSIIAYSAPNVTDLLVSMGLKS